MWAAIGFYVTYYSKHHRIGTDNKIASSKIKEPTSVVRANSVSLLSIYSSVYCVCGRTAAIYCTLQSFRPNAFDKQIKIATLLVANCGFDDAVKRMAILCEPNNNMCFVKIVIFWAICLTGWSKWAKRSHSNHLKMDEWMHRSVHKGAYSLDRYNWRL